MALTRRSLRSMNLTEEQMESIIEMHTETVNALKDDIDKYKTQLEKFEDIQTELNNLKKSVKEEFIAKKDYEDIKTEYQNFKTSIEEKELLKAKENAVKNFFESKNIKGDNLELALMGVESKMNGFEIEDGKIKDTSMLEELVNGKYSRLVDKVQTKGADVANPPNNTGGTEDKPSRAKQLAEQYHSNLYGKKENG